MKKTLFSFIALILLGFSVSGQIIPVEIDLSHQVPEYPFLPEVMPEKISSYEEIDFLFPVVAQTEDGRLVSGQIKYLTGTLENIITQIHIKDESTGEKVKLKVEDIKTIAFATSTEVPMSTVLEQHKAITYTGNENLNNVAVIRDQISFFEKVKITKGKKEKYVLLQAVNMTDFETNHVTVYFDPKARKTQAKVNLEVKKDNYKYKGVVSENVPSAYYVRNMETNKVVHISEKSYKQSLGAYPEEIFSDKTLVSNLKKGNEASVIKYNEANWAFFLLNVINYNKEMVKNK